ncbi:MAG: polyprenyl synthetase family protein [Planctomycetota bacterium]
MTQNAILVADFVHEVKKLVAERVDALAVSLGVRDITGPLGAGKMLRTRLAARLRCAGHALDPDVLVHICAATELVHTASLCHDDVIDGSVVRRALPALWTATSPAAAVLVGDLLMCEASQLVAETAGGRYVRPFVSKVHEVCAAEARQELSLRGKALDDQTSLRLARSKTGPFFALVAMVCSGDEADLARALEEAGYRIGTAYQLADDLWDLVGDEEAAGKTLGTDRRRNKFTLPQAPCDGRRVAAEHVASLCERALSDLAPWPRMAAALEEFLTCDLRPVMERSVGPVDVFAGGGR